MLSTAEAPGGQDTAMARMSRQRAPRCTAEPWPACHHPPHRSPRTSRSTPSPARECSGSVERCATPAQPSFAQSGAGLLAGPLRWTAARVATTSAVVAAAASPRLHCRGQPWASRQGSTCTKVRLTRKVSLSESNACCCCCFGRGHQRGVQVDISELHCVIKELNVQVDGDRKKPQNTAKYQCQVTW